MRNTDSYLRLYMWKTCSEQSHKVHLNTCPLTPSGSHFCCALWSTLWGNSTKIRAWQHIFNTVFVGIRKGKPLISHEKSIKHWASLCHVIKCVSHLSIAKHSTVPTRCKGLQPNMDPTEIKWQDCHWTAASLGLESRGFVRTAVFYFVFLGEWTLCNLVLCIKHISLPQ